MALFAINSPIFIRFSVGRFDLYWTSDKCLTVNNLSKMRLKLFFLGIIFIQIMNLSIFSLARKLATLKITA